MSRQVHEATTDTRHAAAWGARRAVWRQLVARDDERLFRKRLAWDGIDPDNARAAAVLAQRPTGAHWEHTLSDIYGWSDANRSALVDGGSADRALRSDQPLPFETLLLPFIEFARRRLRARAGGCLDLLADTAQAALERGLLQQLTQITARALFAEFGARRANQQLVAVWTIIQGPPASETRDANPVYAGFAASMLRGGLRAFFQRYPVAGEVCVGVVECWVDAAVELVTRLRADRDELARVFNAGQPLGAVAAATVGLSDPHEGRRVVVVLTFESGCTIVYKPRPLGLDRCFGGLIAWINERSGDPPLKACRVVSRPTHGWVEYVSHDACETHEGVERFYHRCGMLLALVYALNGGDFHLENLLASGEQPVLIDFEGLLGHRIENEARIAGASDPAMDLVERSVLKALLLPSWKPAADGRVFSMGGMVGVQDQGQEIEATYWHRPNTDAMRIARRRGVPKPRTSNLPLLDGRPVEAGAYVPCVVAGFVKTYRLLLHHRQAFLAPEGPLAPMSRELVRFIPRHTTLYATLMERSLHPQYLQDEVDRMIQLDVLTTALLPADERPRMWPMVEAERCALSKMDVPFFAAAADSRDLALRTGRVIRGCFRLSAYEEAIERINHLDESDLRVQIGLIEFAFTADAARDLKCATTAPNPAASPAAPAPGSHSIEHAMRIADRLARMAVQSPRGEVGWVVPGYVANVRRYAVGPAGPHLLDGRAGIGLFLAALERVTGGCGFRDLALQTMAPAKHGVRDLETILAGRRRIDIGAGTGLASTAYAFAAIGSLLHESDLVDCGVRVALAISLAAVRQDDALDVVSGSAGAILGLLAVYAVARHDAILERAIACGAHLLASRHEEAETGCRVWHTSNGRAERGFAHGQAGIVHALLRLGRETGDDRLLDAAEEAAASERIALARSHEAMESDTACAAWSHGWTGIGLGRLAAIDTKDAAAARQDVELALAATARHFHDGSADLCTGVMGRVDFFIEAARVLGRPDLHEAARRACAIAVAAADHHGPFRSVSGGATPHPGLFLGWAGIGYELLRATSPETVPSVLLWESPVAAR